MQTINLYSLLDKKFIGADDLRKQLTDILSKLPKEKEIVITQNGKPKGVLLDIKSYLEIEELYEQIADFDPKLIKKVNKAVEEIKKHGGIPAEKVWKQLGI
ncbi:type II toxin-antitoxin system prevent-host-death family antitoxin [Candidatus Daviesbacteria bacterium]|nr:type II toxin-antitoxin system prevent-host-death family antitoxin [Candidatus Daviesbacteria bacterium]